MSGVNKVILVGHLGKDPEVRSLESGAKVATFSLATSETYKNKEGQRVDQTEWHNIVVWRGLADIAEKFLKKGGQVYIEGRIRNRTYEKDGQKKYITEINADNLVLLGKKEALPGENRQTIADPPDFEQPGITEDLPF